MGIKPIWEFGGTEDREFLLRSLDRFSGARVLVIGDIILDEYVWGEVSRISPEAPVPVVEVKRETRMLGGAANVVHNMATLGAKPLLCGVIGDDETGRVIMGELSRLGLSPDGIIVEAGRPTSIKTRVVAKSQQVVRFDRESNEAVRGESIQALLDFVEERIGDCDVLVVSDYGKGVISGAMMGGLRGLIRPGSNGSMIIAVDPKTGNFQHYREVNVITPNHHEAGAYCGFAIVDETTLVRAGKQMLEDLQCGSVLITQGKDGMTLFENGGAVIRIPTVARKVFDVTGAGDTVIGTFALGLASGLGPRAAAFLSNLAAGLVVGEVGTSTVRVEDLKDEVRRT